MVDAKLTSVFRSSLTVVLRQPAAALNVSGNIRQASPAWGLGENPIFLSPVNRKAIFPEAFQAVAGFATFENFDPYGSFCRV